MQKLDTIIGRIEFEFYIYRLGKDGIYARSTS